MLLKPFDGKAICQKCGHLEVSVTYHKDRQYLCPAWPRVTSEHLDRYCRRCGYEWVEAVLGVEGSVNG